MLYYKYNEMSERGQMAKENRNFKDSVFTDLFCSDKYAKRNLLDLYNALYGENLQDENVLEQVRLENVLFKNFQNDIAFLVGNKKIILGEHQSTINENMPLRSLMYIAREYERIVKPDDRYRASLIEIPTPEFYAFYNGTEKYPLERELRLSDAFKEKMTPPSLELTVKVININPSEGHEILGKCEVLKQYSMFVEIARECKGDKGMLSKAVKRCIEDGILTEYLQRKSSEVVNMLMVEYNYDTDMRVQREEGEKIGRAALRKTLKQVAAFLKKNPSADMKEIAAACGCTEAEAKDAKDVLDSLF